MKKVISVWHKKLSWTNTITRQQQIQHLAGVLDCRWIDDVENWNRASFPKHRFDMLLFFNGRRGNSLWQVGFGTFKTQLMCWVLGLKGIRFWNQVLFLTSACVGCSVEGGECNLLIVSWIHASCVHSVGFTWVWLTQLGATSVDLMEEL